MITVQVVTRGYFYYMFIKGDIMTNETTKKEIIEELQHFYFCFDRKFDKTYLHFILGKIYGMLLCLDYYSEYLYNLARKAGNCL